MRYLICIMLYLLLISSAVGEEMQPAPKRQVNEARALAQAEAYLLEEYGWHSYMEQRMRNRVTWNDPFWTIEYELGRETFCIRINKYTGEIFSSLADAAAINAAWKAYREDIYDQFDKDYFRHPQELRWDGEEDMDAFFEYLPFGEPEDVIFIEEEAAHIRDLLSVLKEKEQELGDSRFWSIEEKAAFYFEHKVNADSPCLDHLLYYEGNIIHQALGAAYPYGLPQEGDYPYEMALNEARKGICRHLGADEDVLSLMAINAVFHTQLDFSGHQRAWRFAFHLPLADGAGEAVYTAWVLAENGEAVFLSGDGEIWAKDWYFSAMAYLEKMP